MKYVVIKAPIVWCWWDDEAASYQNYEWDDWYSYIVLPYGSHIHFFARLSNQ